MDAYATLRLLGEGAYGRVFLAREKRPPARLVCVKQLLARVPAASAQSEVRLMQRVRHPNVVRFFHAVATTRVIVMEFCPGGDLRAFLRRRPAPSIHEDRVWYWAVQLCLALSYLHDAPSSSTARAIWHRDLKTSNVFLGASGFLVLGDLGVAREPSSSESLASTVVGTPLYMAPEIWDGRPYDGACDLWALGCTLYEICAGHTPFEDARSTPALVKRACEAKYAPLPSGKWSPRLRRLVDELLSVDPAKRPSAAAILRQSENAVHVKRYLQDRVEAAVRSGSAKDQEQEEQAILRTQLRSLGITVGDVERPVERPVERLRQPHAEQQQREVALASGGGGGGRVHLLEAEQRRRLQRELERQEQLRVALQRMQDLRHEQLQMHQRAIESEHAKRNDRQARPAAGTRVVKIAAAADEDVAWTAPVQASSSSSHGRPSSAASSSSSSKRRTVAKAIAFVGIPRQGVPLTRSAKAFAAKTQSPLCRDVRQLRKIESSNAAARYRTTLDEQFNRKDPQAKQKQQPRRSGGEGGSEATPFAVAREGDEDDDAAVVDACLAQLEAALRAQLHVS